jgi:PPOX class probable F420-dependent enzyme
MQSMNRQQALAFLAEGARTGKLATASPGGDPHVAPVWFVVDGDSVMFTTYHTTVKARHLAANPRAALACDDERFPFSFVVVRGRVEVDRAAPDMFAWTRRLAARYVPADQADEYGRRNAVEGEWLCRLRVDRVVGQVALAG